MFSIKNAVYVALLQIGVIVAGVLAAGLVFKMAQTGQWPLPAPAALLLNHTLLFMAAPLLWFTVALGLRARTEMDDSIKHAVFWLGVLGLVGLVIFVGYADISPWLDLSRTLSRLDDT